MGPASGYVFREHNDIRSTQKTQENYRGAISNKDINILRIDGNDYQLNGPELKKSSSLEGLLTAVYKNPHKNDGNINLIQESLIDGMRYSTAGSLIFHNNIDRSSYKAENTDSHWFYQGIVPTNMPTAGQARYEGNSYLFSYGPEQGDRSLYDTQASANFDVDFGAKTIAGQLNNWVNIDGRTEYGFSFNGNVHGNTFSAKENKIYYHGGFFGPNAEELGGVMRHDDDKVNGYFGAHKQ